jgi:hypothetical protein
VVTAAGALPSLLSVYQCELRAEPGAEMPETQDALTTLLLTDGDAADWSWSDRPGWATDGYYAHALLLPGNLADHYVDVLKPLRHAGVGTFSIPLIPLHTVLDAPSGVTVTAKARVASVVARVEPGWEWHTSDTLRTCLAGSAGLKPGDLNPTVFSHGSIDLIIPGPREARSI